ncbi:uncharacterized protein LOC129266517 [Lytechinus pictus]|uniref:uncharacterized protein LOC129266517 n=1 Tax=Lytechinus pictus TaxID=7653 RepID=UPI0030B9E3F0
MLRNVYQNCLPFGIIFIFFQFGFARGSDIPDEIVPVNDGDTATLRCRISTNRPEDFDRLSWTKDDLPEKIARIQECKDIQISNSSCNIFVSTPGKYSVAGDLASGSILRVMHVTIDDDGIYTCKAIILGGSPSKRIRLAVLRPPTDITLLDIDKQLALTERDVMHVVRNRANRINCTVPSSNPEANINWSYGDVNVNVHEQTNRSVGSDVPFMTSTRALDIFPTAAVTGTMITCVVTHYGLLKALQKNFILNVGSIKAIYNPRDRSVDITRPHRGLDPLPIGICFQLVQTSSSNSADPALEESECVGVNESVPIPPGWTVNKLAIVTYGNTALSAPSEILGISKARTGLIVGLTLGILVFIAAIFILYKMKKRHSGMQKARVMRQLPAQPKPAKDEGETNTSPEYHYVDDSLQDKYTTDDLYGTTKHLYQEGALQAAPDTAEDSSGYSMKIAKTKAGITMYKCL